MKVFSRSSVFKDKAEIHCNNQSAIHLCKNLMYHEGTKHVGTRYHFIRAKFSYGLIQVEKISTEENPTDRGTKVLLLSKFKHCIELLKVGDG